MKCLIGIVAYFLNNKDTFRTFLLALAKQASDYTSAKITEIIKQILVEFVIKDRIGYFITNNVGENDIDLYNLTIKY